MASWVEVDRISASVSVSAPIVDKWALSADIRFRPKAVLSHSVHFRFRRTAFGKFGGCRKWVCKELELRRPECARRGKPLASLCTDYTEEGVALSLSASVSGTVGPCH